MDVIYIAHINTCRYAFRLVILLIQHKWKLKLVNDIPLNSQTSNFMKSSSVFLPCYMHIDGWTDRAVLTDILQNVNVPQPATQNQISWLGKTGKG